MTCHLAWSHIVTKVVLEVLAKAPSLLSALHVLLCSSCAQDAVGSQKQDEVRSVYRKGVGGQTCLRLSGT